MKARSRTRCKNFLVRAHSFSQCSTRFRAQALLYLMPSIHYECIHVKGSVGLGNCFAIFDSPILKQDENHSGWGLRMAIFSTEVASQPATSVQPTNKRPGIPSAQANINQHILHPSVSSRTPLPQAWFLPTPSDPHGPWEGHLLGPWEIGNRRCALQHDTHLSPSDACPPRSSRAVVDYNPVSASEGERLLRRACALMRRCLSLHPILHHPNLRCHTASSRMRDDTGHGWCT